MKGSKGRGATLSALIIAVGLLLGLTGLSSAKMDMKKPKTPAKDQQAAYQLYKSKCLGCHVSVADPERPGKTRDDWMVVVKFMNQHFVNLTDDQAEKIIDLLFSLRPGIEKEAG